MNHIANQRPQAHSSILPVNAVGYLDGNGLQPDDWTQTRLALSTHGFPKYPSTHHGKIADSLPARQHLATTARAHVFRSSLAVAACTVHFDDIVTLGMQAPSDQNRQPQQMD